MKETLLDKIPKFMRIICVTLLLIVDIAMFSELYAQPDGWERDTSKDRKIEVNYHVGYRMDKNGEKAQLMEYTASTLTNLPIDKCVSAMRNVSLHEKFMGDTEESFSLEAISENQWIAYYFFNPPWPMPDNDCVMDVNLEKSDDGKTYSFNGESVPDLIVKKKVKRIEYYEYIFKFEEKEDKKVEFSISVKLTPVGSFPNWMIKTWFPKGPIDFIENFLEVADKQL